MTAPTYPLPNEFLNVGDLCPKSFAGNPLNHTTPVVQDGVTLHDWGACNDCGEVLNLRRKYVPEHVIPDRTNR